MLRNGTLRKLYDIFDSLTVAHTTPPNPKTENKPDTIYINLSKKNYNQLVKLRSDSFLNPRNYLNYNWQWLGERKWFKASFSIAGNSSVKAKVKLIGMNTDHFRDGSNWSLRVKLDSENYYKGYKKFNLINPYSRGFFTDQFFNLLYQQNGGLSINQLPVYVRMGDHLSPQVLEPFFSKELIESQQRRDYLILVADSVDRNGKNHLKVAHPSNNIALLTQRQQLVYRFYDSVYALGKIKEYYNIDNYAFLTAVALNNGNDTHHYNGFNLYLYVDPICGDLKPFLREVSSVNVNDLVYSYDSLKSAFFNSQNLSGFAQRLPDFDRKVDKYVSILQAANTDSLIQSCEDLRALYSFCNTNFPWSSIYKTRMRVKLKGISQLKVLPTAKKKIKILSGNVLFKDTVIQFNKQDSIIIAKGSRITCRNTTLIFSEVNLAYQNQKELLQFIGDSLSSMIFDNCQVYLENSSFKGFGNHLHGSIRNREVTGAFTFINSGVRFQNVIFSNNYSGDDLVNFFRCVVEINNSKFLNSYADGIDFDFAEGTIANSFIFNCRNDGLDIGGSSIFVKNNVIEKCGDKGVSIGEASLNIHMEKNQIFHNEIGVSLKDASQAYMYKNSFNKNSIDFVAYAKKAQFGHSKLLGTDLNFSKLSYLIEPGVYIPEPIKILRTPNVINFMYGKKYGKKSDR